MDKPPWAVRFSIRERRLARSREVRPTCLDSAIICSNLSFIFIFHFIYPLQVSRLHLHSVPTLCGPWSRPGGYAQTRCWRFLRVLPRYLPETCRQHISSARRRGTPWESAQGP